MRFVLADVKPVSIIVAMVLLCATAIAQKSGQRDFEIGAMGGVSWYNGDLNTKKMFGRDYLNQAYGISMRQNLSRRFALRGTFNIGSLNAADENANQYAQVIRNLSFTTRIYEVAGLVEFNFLEFDALVSKHLFSPYTFIGLSVFHFNPTTEVEGSIYELQPLATESKNYKLTSVAVPFGFGFKCAFTDRVIAHVDWGMRRTFTDHLDDVGGDYPDPAQVDGLSENLSDRSLEQIGPDGTNWGTQRGNAKTQDWYSFVMAGLSVRIGPKKGSCKHIGI